MTARLFTAVELSSEVRDRVVSEQGRLASRLSGLSIRWVSRDHLHVTLVFLGEVPADRVPCVMAALDAPFALSPFRLEFSGAGLFPDRGRPRALWLGISQGRPQLAELRELVAARLSAAGFAVDARPFAPHLTVGRFRTGHPADRAPVAAVRASGQAVAAQEVRGLALFESRLSPVGSEYTVRLRTRLAGTALH